MSGKITVYYSSVTGNKEIKKQQQRITMVLESKKIDVELVDIASSEESKAKMRTIAENEKQMVPVICNEDQFCGDYNAFDEAVEGEQLMKFLKLE